MSPLPSRLVLFLKYIREMYLVGQLDKVRSNESTTKEIAVSDLFDGKRHGSYFLSVDCLMWAINFNPASVVDCGVSTSGDSAPYPEQCTVNMY